MVAKHAYEPNPDPPSATPDFQFVRPDHLPEPFTVQDLNNLPQTEITDCYIVSTGHGTSGPFRFQGVTLRDFIYAVLPAGWPFTEVEVLSGDGFGTRILAEEIMTPADRPVLLATGRDGYPLTRAQGLVRLIVPTETDDALRQVKWVQRIMIHP